ncbi:crotonase/enoyl-CoA hydratase family protein [Gordonia soli]|uniref:Putative enoyl-CoA hydratase n=1 Tax=Gordonia soli NBRC 108243 TaxID=1223545 RepID=M0QH24_9ACTN|nr:crotonase/enoyl-CoA hydratase family protein [Gordonia soli]GAC67616.1 putative enoyl-CoA hydratase [Gordonia soli NBRC 108243]
MTDRVRLDVRDGVAQVTLARPDKLNAIDFAMLDALSRLPSDIAGDKEIRAVVLRGDGDAFCTGLDFASVGKEPRRAVTGLAKLPIQTTNLFQKACWAWRELPVPVLAVLHGHCYGGGLQLALAADFRVATPDCQMSIMEGKFGLIPDMTGSVTLRELIPMDLAKYLTMTAEVFDGSRALEYGLVTDIADDPFAAAETMVAKLVDRSPDSLAATKKLFHETWTASPRSAFWTETVLQARLVTGKNHKIARTGGGRSGLSWVPRSLG